MNKNIFIYSLICAVFAVAHTKTSAIATPRNYSSADITLISDSYGDGSSTAFNNFSDRTEDNLTRIIFFLGLIGTGALFWAVLKSRQGNAKGSLVKIEHKSNKALLDRVSPKLRRQLLRLINDPQTANRLLMGIYQNNRDRSPNWIAEKAIYDLRRGR